MVLESIIESILKTRYEFMVDCVGNEFLITQRNISVSDGAGSGSSGGGGGGGGGVNGSHVQGKCQTNVGKNIRGKDQIQLRR